MACFIVPAAEAIVATAVEKQIEKNEGAEKRSGNVFLMKFKWLLTMLWGGAALLAFEHIWHGEVVPFFPFLTNAANPADRAEMLHEMSTVGVTMAVLVTVVWFAMVLVSTYIEKRPERERR
ncbi:MAG: hypothetical protein IJ608_14850 [Lachnospiraceae bacterium]|nr:hypothetical protein [Lachnospiraceae bacterium]